jgi:C-methyltransferase
MIEQRPHEIIWNLTNAEIASRCLHVVAELGVADAMTDEPVTAAVLASSGGVNAEALHRILCLLADHGVFSRDGLEFSHSPASQLLRTDHPMSMRAFPQMMNQSVIQDILGRLDHSVRTGAPATEVVSPEGLWSYYQSRPEESETFGRAMTAKASGDIACVLGAYDFSRFGVIADIGGGRGHLLRAALKSAPRASGVLFDLPEVTSQADVNHERLTVQAGDFFHDRLPVADAYLLMEVLHDWPDAEAAEILGAIRTVAPPGATVLVIENVLPDQGPDPRGHTLDVIMLAVTGGRERTPSELTQLFNRAGLSNPTIINTDGPLRIAEGRSL